MPTRTGTKLKKSHPEIRLSNHDLYLFNEGSHFQLYDKLGAHIVVDENGVEGTHFSVWAPDAKKVTVIGDFNGWNKNTHPLSPEGHSGIWSGFIANAHKGNLYKYHVESKYHGFRVDKADPFAFHSSVPSDTASKIWDLDYEWQDKKWMEIRKSKHTLNSPISIYEMHIDSWKRVPEENNRPLSYRELAQHLPRYLKDMGFTHVELLPIMEFPFTGSWGYQSTGYFAPSSRYGTPQDFMFLVDSLHQQGIGILLDWVPSHFPNDEHGLAYFDGTHLYEHADPRQGFHPDWKSAVFNYGRNEVRSFLISSALFWMEKYHIDGIRVDAVASMLYLDYSRKDGEWIPNQFGGRENVNAIQFLRRLNERIYAEHPDALMIAEESTAWPMVTRPTYMGGLGFLFKWDMGWMHDTLSYFSKDPIHRRYHHSNLTFRMLYSFHENFVLSLSHDEVVHGKGSLINKMPGDLWQKFANLRALYGYMFAQPGKKLLFMGGEFGQWSEWNHNTSLDWHLLDYPAHSGLQKWIADLNKMYQVQPALHELDCSADGFEWIDCNDTDHSVVSLLRKGTQVEDTLVFACNFTPVPLHQYRIGVPSEGRWEELLNSDAPIYGGSGQGNMGGVNSSPAGWHGKEHSIEVTIPPLGVCVFKRTPSST